MSRANAFRRSLHLLLFCSIGIACGAVPTFVVANCGQLECDEIQCVWTSWNTIHHVDDPKAANVFSPTPIGGAVTPLQNMIGFFNSCSGGGDACAGMGGSAGDPHEVQLCFDCVYVRDIADAMCPGGGGPHDDQ